MLSRFKMKPLETKTHMTWHDMKIRQIWKLLSRTRFEWISKLLSLSFESFLFFIHLWQQKDFSRVLSFDHIHLFLLQIRKLMMLDSSMRCKETNIFNLTWLIVLLCPPSLTVHVFNSFSWGKKEEELMHKNKKRSYHSIAWTAWNLICLTWQRKRSRHTHS